MTVLSDKKRELIKQLQKNVLWQLGIKPPEGPAEGIGLGPVENAFPHGVFPAGSVHELVSANEEEAAASSGFMVCLLAALMRQGGVCLWIGPSGTVFPPALKAFGLEPDRIIFADLKRERDILWAMEEALKCGGLAAAVAELPEMDFIQSRRLQLAVEKSKVTGFVLRSNSRKTGATACAARWRIKPLPSEPEEGMPGVGFPRWEVELLKVRNGNPGTWKLEWTAEGFVPVYQPAETIPLPAQERKAG